MKKQTRVGVFETNSSSTHSLTICTEDDFERFKDGKFMSRYGELVKPDPEDENQVAYEDMGSDLEYFEERFTTPSGDKMVAFGEYGERY